jgi:hypothetical protein
MRQALAIATVVALGLIVTATPAGAGSTKGPTLRSLQAQIKTLQKQVKTLKKQVTDTEDVALASLVYGACSTAVTADTFQDTYAGLDGYFGAHTLPAYFGAQVIVNDYQTCQALEITRVHSQKPPTTSVLRALLDLFKSSSAAVQQNRVGFGGQADFAFNPFLAMLR